MKELAVGLFFLSCFFLPLLSDRVVETEDDECSLIPHKHFIVYSKRVVTPLGTIAAAVEVNEGRIVSVLEKSEVPEGTHGLEVMDYGNAVIMPGLVDVHVHLNEPGREEWEGFWTGTRAAAAGGLTTIIDMPLNSLPTTTTKEALELKISSSNGKLAVDVGFWGGLVPENAFNSTALDEILNFGALGLKAFMCPSGINDFPMTDSSHIRAALPVLAKYRRPLLVHSEISQTVEDYKSQDSLEVLSIDERRKYSTYLKTRPPSWERAAVQELVNIAHDTVSGGSAEGAHIHVVHLSDADGSLHLIKEAKAFGASLSVETCPHYLAFSAEEIDDGDTRFKCAPPIRTRENRELLWNALKDGYIDVLSSDHSPTLPELKLLVEGDFLRAWGGISSLQFVLPITWTFGMEHNVSLEEISHWWSSNPAELAGLTNKGHLETGKDADILVWDPETSFVIDEDFVIYHKHKITPYTGKMLYGRVISTFVRGKLVFHEGHHALKSCGAPLLATQV
eukprot:c15825_g1_i1 orf=317-1837(+)